MPNIKEIERMTLSEAVKALIAEGVAKTRAGALVWLRKNLPHESTYQGHIMAYLKKRGGCAYWKNAAGPYQIQGVADVECVIEGMYFAFEVKRPLIGEASAAQKAMQRKVRQAGGVYEFVSFPDEVERIIREELFAHLAQISLRMSGDACAAAE